MLEHEWSVGAEVENPDIWEFANEFKLKSQKPWQMV
jgi:hypothetical protein